MTIVWENIFMSLIPIALVLLFFFSLYKFARRMIIHTRTTEEILRTLVRIEKKLNSDTIRMNQD